MIQLTFEIIKNNKLPKGKIILNDNVLHNNFYDFTTFDIKPRVGSNVLQITLDNKVEKEDTVMQGNKIVKDVCVILKEAKCMITKEILTNLDIDSSYATDKGEKIKTYGYLSYNGTYTFNFDYPFFVFQKKKVFYQ